MPQVFLSPKSPGDSKQYEKHEIDNLIVYIKSDLILDDEIRVRFPKVASDLSGREFEVVGATPPVQ